MHEKKLPEISQRQSKEIKPSRLINFMLDKVGKQYTRTPEADFCFAVFRQAVDDYFFPGKHGSSLRDRDTAEEYLFRSKILHLELLGIDSEWVKGLLRRAQTSAVFMNEPEKESLAA